MPHTVKAILEPSRPNLAALDMNKRLERATDPKHAPTRIADAAGGTRSRAFPV